MSAENLALVLEQEDGLGPLEAQLVAELLLRGETVARDDSDPRWLRLGMLWLRLARLRLRSPLREC